MRQCIAILAIAFFVWQATTLAHASSGTLDVQAEYVAVTLANNSDKLIGCNGRVTGETIWGERYFVPVVALILLPGQWRTVRLNPPNVLSPFTYGWNSINCFYL